MKSEATRIARSFVLVAIALCGVVSLTGAALEPRDEGPALKVAFVDVERVRQENRPGQDALKVLQKKQLDAEKTIRAWKSNPLLAPADQKSLADLSLADGAAGGLTPAQTTQLEALKSQSRKLNDDFLQLQQAAPATLKPEDSARLQDYTKRLASTQSRCDTLDSQTTADLNSQADALRTQMNDAVRTAVSKVAKDKSYDVIYSSAAVLYSRNDATDQVLKILNQSGKP